MSREERLLQLLERAHATLARLLRDNGIARELRVAIEEERARAGAAAEGSPETAGGSPAEDPVGPAGAKPRNP